MESKENLLTKSRVLDLVQVALMAAIVYVSVAFINVPSVKGVIHLGDTTVFLSAILLRRKKAFAASAIGMCLFDLLSPYYIWAPFTFIIKGTMALIAGTIAYRKGYNGKSIGNNIFAFAVAGLFMIVAYYFAGAFIFQSFIVALADIQGNIIQVVAGVALAMPLTIALKRVYIFKERK